MKNSTAKLKIAKWEHKTATCGKFDKHFHLVAEKVSFLHMRYVTYTTCFLIKDTFHLQTHTQTHTHYHFKLYNSETLYSVNTRSHQDIPYIHDCLFHTDYRPSF